MSYLVAIKTALLVFPIIAFMFTMPYVIKQYRKYGSINGLRTIVVFSFILYMITVYFLVILPLPKLSEVTKPVGDMVQLIPFQFVVDFFKETSFDIARPSTYLTTLLEPGFYTVLLNIVMCIPFGMYMRYYFECDLKVTLKWSFLLSLFFELTQLTGLYFIYPYPYRVFDVDDLLMNTLGGLIGFYLGNLCTRFLPSRKEIDRESFERGKIVSTFRRFTCAFIDMVIFGFIALIAVFFVKLDYIFLVTFIIYFAVIPFYIGSTLGGKILKIKIVYANCEFLRSLARTVFLYLYYLCLPFKFLEFTIKLVGILGSSAAINIFIYIGLFIIFVTFYLFNIIYIVKNKRSFYDEFLGAKYESTIMESKESV